MSEKHDTNETAGTEKYTTVNRRRFVKSLGVAGGVSALGIQGVGSAAASNTEVEHATATEKQKIIKLVESSEKFGDMVQVVEDEFQSEITLSDPEVVNISDDNNPIHVASYKIEDNYSGFDAPDDIAGRQQTIGMKIFDGEVLSGYSEIIHEYTNLHVNYITFSTGKKSNDEYVTSSSVGNVSNVEAERGSLNFQEDIVETQCIGCPPGTYCRNCQNLAPFICNDPAYACGLSSVVACGIVGIGTGGAGAVACGVILNHICNNLGSCTANEACAVYC